jgi:hypothetical protein
MHRRPCICILALLTATTARAIGWGCSGHDSGFLGPSPWLLNALETSPLIDEHLDQVNSRTFGPFDSRRFGFEYVDWIAVPHDPRLDTETRRSEVIEVPYFRLHLRGGRTESWWELSVRHGLDSPFGTWQPGADDLAFAADVEIPLFLLAYEHSAGSAGFPIWQNNVIIDLRPGTPELLAHLQCDQAEGIGACTAPDRADEGREAYSCQYSEPDQDFRCQHTVTYSSEWTTRVFETCFLLQRATDVACAPPPGEVARDLAEVALRLQTGALAVGNAVHVPGVGMVRALVSFAGRRRGTTHFLLAAPGVTKELDVRLYLVTTRRGATPTVTPLDWVTVGSSGVLEPTEPGLPDELETGTPVGPPPAFKVADILKKRAIHLVQLVVSERDARGLVWVAIDDSREPLKSQALLLATNVGDYIGCGAHHFSPQLAPDKPKLAPFPATVSYKPDLSEARGLSEGRETRDDATEEGFPRKARLSWVPGRGFQLDVLERGEPLFAAPTAVHIDDAGNVTFERRLP